MSSSSTHRQRSSSVNSVSSNHSMTSSILFPPPPPPFPFPLSQSTPPILQHSTSTNSTTTNANANTTTTPTTLQASMFPTPINTSIINPSHITHLAPTPTTVRSLSIVSLESPRNSIISFDDCNYIRPTRNNSSASLASLNSTQHTTTVTTSALTNHPINTASGSISANSYTVTTPAILPSSTSTMTGITSDNGTGTGGNNNRVRQHHRTSSVLLSDEDSELDSHTPTRNILHPVFRLKRKNSKEENQLLQLKRDFKLRFDELLLSSTTSTTASASMNSNQSSPTTLLPTSPSTALHPSSHHNHLSQHINDSPRSNAVVVAPKLQDLKPISLSDPAVAPTTNPAQPATSSSTTSTCTATSKKKTKSNSLIQQSMFIKRKLAISKDLQMELSTTATATTPNTHPTMSPPLLPTSISSPGVISIPHLNQLTDSKLIVAKKPVVATGVGVVGQQHQPVMQTLSQQNELINKLNRKWNKAIMNPSGKDDDEGEVAGIKKSTKNLRKRSRRISFDADDEEVGVDDDDDGYYGSYE
ncbi:uncharacterized protein J8A68_000573 [[Candida] subhashii]|uniref:Uncharacterized protein n=1 Tax=[Candida] subhashii TaxID=561895 RepID=A0A8J5R6W2_9ASCO|nr:uncharacterized protein J8A68_000573 [[Candida] subhashii]KAG7665950.1 hypothetical protein J8A68_000573 [[Candida] subhashii]